MSDLLERVRARLWQEPSLREVNMFGGISFMVRDLMVVAVRKDESLLVRVDPEDSPTLLARPGASISMMGKNREMGPGWISVTADALASEDALQDWLDVGLAYNERQSS